MVKASTTQRFGAYLIDIAIIYLILSIVMRIVTSNITIPSLEGEVVDAMGKNLKEFFESDKTGFLYNILLTTNVQLKEEYAAWTKTTEFIQFYADYTSALYTVALISILSIIIIVFLYMVLLPKFWNKQTVGRMLMKVKVVNQFGENASFKQLLVREEICGVFRALFDFFFFAPLIINITLIYGKQASIGDLVTSTLLIRYDEEGIEKEDNSEVIDNVNINNENIVKDEDIVIDLDEE